jgi:hypothetical protein
MKAAEVGNEVMPEVTVGYKIPAVSMKEGLGDFKSQDVNIAEFIAGKKVVIFGVPGAFTPGCSKSHLPSFIEAQDSLKAKGVELTICVATNDLFVMEVRIQAPPLRCFAMTLISNMYTLPRLVLIPCRPGVARAVERMLVSYSFRITRQSLVEPLDW